MRHVLVASCIGALLAAGVAPARAQSVGVAAAINQSALGTPPGTRTRTLSLGDKVIHNEKITTNGKGLLQILLADGTSFTVGPSSNMVIDSFVYDPDADTAKVVATFGKGVFRFIGGRTSKSPGGAILDTPVGTVGIRGGIGDFDFSGRHGVPQHIDMLFGDSITLSRGGRQIGRLYQSGYSLVIGGNGITSIPTPPAWTSQFRLALAGHPGASHNGPGQHLTSTVVANLLSGPSGPPTGPAAPVPLPSLSGLAGTPGLQPPPVAVPTQPTEGAASWAEINNSSLANVFATYSGPASINYTITAEGAPPVSDSWNGTFNLHYHFGRGDGGGDIGFTGMGVDSGDDVLAIPVTPNNTTGTGIAGFSGGYDDTADENNYIRFNTQGQFRNTAAGVGNGVTGTISLDAKGQGLDLNNQAITGTGTARGTFSGNLTGTRTGP